MAKNAANPSCGGLAVLLHADSLSFQFLGRTNAKIAIAEYISMAKGAGGKDRNCDIGKRALAAQREIHRQRHFGNIEGIGLDLTGKYFRRRLNVQKSKIDPKGLHAPS